MQVYSDGTNTIDMTDNRERILGIIRGIRRPGTDAVIGYLKSSGYFTRGCYKHHRERGGLAQHSIEVYEHMLSHAGNLSAESIAVAALFHDLGKTVPGAGRDHGRHSIAILDRLGFPLTDEERMAIRGHHDSWLDLVTCPLRRALSMADSYSTGRWKHSHRKPDGHLQKNG